MAKFWVTSKDVQIVIWLKSYNDSDPSNNKKLAKIVQTQPSAAPALFSLSLSEFLQFKSTVKLRSTVFRNILHFNVSHLSYTNFTEFLHFNVKDMRQVSSNPSFSWEVPILRDKDIEQFAQGSLKKNKKQMPFNICAKELLH